MIVLDEKHYRGVLLEKDKQRYLDAVRSHSAAESWSPWKVRSLVLTPEYKRANEAIDAWQRRKSEWQSRSAP